MNENKLFLDLNYPLPLDVQRCKDEKEYDKALSLINDYLDNEINDIHLKNCLLLNKEICLRIDLEYQISFDEAYKIIKEKINDFTKEELNRYIEEKRFSYIKKNSEIYVFNRFFGCLEKYDDFNLRLNKEVTKNDNSLIEKIIKEKHVEEKIRIKHTIKIKDEYFKQGMNVVVHLPVPKICDHQKNIVIEDYSKNAYLSDENYTYRTICFKEKMSENHEFFVTYSYDSFYNYVDLNKKNKNKEVYEYLDEQYPHIVFTDKLKQLAFNLTKDKESDLDKARAIYNYITLNMNYSFQPSYFVMDNIPEYVVTNLRGDCGFFALTFITLCRIVGIPAYFESGLAVKKDDIGAHDWARFYIKEYGWLYADPSYGVGAKMHNNEEKRLYYFGNLDHERMVANSSYMPTFEIEKKFYSADPCDNQTGEIETDEYGLTPEMLEHTYSFL